MASCKNLKNDKTCSISYCYKCLSNRLYNASHNFIFSLSVLCSSSPSDLVDFESDTERKQKRWHCWRVGSALSAETFAIAVFAGEFPSSWCLFVRKQRVS